jgi:hypothetical protein
MIYPHTAKLLSKKKGVENATKEVNLKGIIDQTYSMIPFM